MKDTEHMEDTEQKKKGVSKKLKLWIIVFALILSIAAVTSLTVSAWLIVRKELAAYAPVSTNEALYIGAGHAEGDTFESVRYLYFNGIDASDETGYSDYVFCVFGHFVSGFRLQLAYTTNNQFTYEIYNATESSTNSAGAVEHTTHTSPAATYYYTINGAAIAGSFLNATTDNGETVADTASVNEKHTDTYGSYATGNVNKYAEPLYWQTSSTITGNSHGDFVKYFILRVYTGDKESNDRETDVLCIAAKSFAISS